jgi:hypothetical protein
VQRAKLGERLLVQTIEHGVLPVRLIPRASI